MLFALQDFVCHLCIINEWSRVNETMDNKNINLTKDCVAYFWDWFYPLCFSLEDNIEVGHLRDQKGVPYSLRMTEAHRLKDEADPPGLAGARLLTWSVISLYTEMYWRRLRFRTAHTLWLAAIT